MVVVVVVIIMVENKTGFITLYVEGHICIFLSLFPALGRSAELLGLDSTQLTEALTQRSMILRGEEILTPLSIQQVKASQFWHVFRVFGRCLSLQVQRNHWSLKNRSLAHASEL